MLENNRTSLLRKRARVPATMRCRHRRGLAAPGCDSPHRVSRAAVLAGGRRLGQCLLLTFLSATCFTAASQVYRIAPHSVRQVTLNSGLLDHQPPSRLIVLGIAPILQAGPGQFSHRLPTASGSDATMDLNVRELSLIDVELARRHPFEHPFKRVLIYWGCGETPGSKQPRAFRTERDDDARISARLAPSPTDSKDRSFREISVDRKLIAREDIRFPERATLIGVHEIRRGATSTMFRVNDQSDFLEPVEISRVWVSDEGTVRLHWKRNPLATAYFVNSYVQHKSSPDVVIWTSSRVPEAGWIVSQSHPGAENLARLRENGVLLGADAEQCTVPAAVSRHAVNGLVVQVHAYGPEVQVPSRSDETPAVSQVRIAPRSTSSVFLQTPFRFTSSDASDVLR